MGENGAGESILIKVLTGLYEKDAGDILFDGQPLELNSPEDAPKLGISAVYQEINLIPALSVAENIYIGDNGKPIRAKKTFYQVRDMERKGAVSAFDLDICKGEVLGLAGLLGSGRTEIARLLFGIDRPNKGRTTLNGRKVSITSPRKAIAHFFGFCPEDRKIEGLVSDLTVRENIILAIHVRNGIFKTIPRKKQEEIVDRYICLFHRSLKR